MTTLGRAERYATSALRHDWDPRNDGTTKNLTDEDFCEPEGAVASARFLEATDSLGSIAVGQLADLVLLDADPFTDIHNASRIRAVVLNGQLLTRKDLDGLLRGAEAFAKSH